MKTRITKIGTTFLAIVVLIGVIGITFAFFGEEKTTKKISPSFSIGGLKSDGKYLETKESIYTKELFECRGLTITPDFESQVSYQIFFYDAEGEFLEATPKLTGTFNQVPDTATHARMVITPMNDEEVKFYEIRGYAKQLELVVSKNQKLPVADEPEIGDTGNGDSSDTEGSTGNEETNNNGSSTGGNNPSVDDNTSSGDDDSQDIVNLYKYQGIGNAVTEDGEVYTDENNDAIVAAFSEVIDVSDYEKIRIRITLEEYQKRVEFSGYTYSYFMFGEKSSDIISDNFVFFDLSAFPSSRLEEPEIVGTYVYLIYDVSSCYQVLVSSSVDSADNILIEHIDTSIWI